MSTRTLTARLDISDIVLTAIIPENRTFNKKLYAKEIRVLRSHYNVNVELPAGTKVRLPGNSTEYAVKLDDTTDLSNLPQEDLFGTLQDDTLVVEDGCLPYKLTESTKVKLPENCKLTFPSGTRLQGPDGLLTLQNPTIVELAPKIKPMAVTTTPSKVIPNEEIDILLVDIINQVKDLKDVELLRIINRSIEWAIFKARRIDL